MEWRSSEAFRETFLGLVAVAVGKDLVRPNRKVPVRRHECHPLLNDLSRALETVDQQPMFAAMARIGPDNDKLVSLHVRKLVVVVAK